MLPAEREQPPQAGDALQLVRPAIVEGEPGTGDEVANGLRDEDLARPGLRGDPGTDRDSDSRDLSVEQLALARMDPGADLEAELLDVVTDRDRAPDGSCRPVEACEEPVARGVELAAVEPRQSRAHTAVMLADEAGPGTIAQLRRTGSRSDQVGEEDPNPPIVIDGVFAATA